MISFSVFCITAVAFLVRLYKIHFPAYVCWDETHFGKMSGYYINGTFFLDVHPPLGKLIIACIGWVCGYDGTFTFKNPGDSYESFNASEGMLVPYTAMRIGCAIFGVFTVLIVHFIILNVVHRHIAAFLTSMFLILDNGLLVLSRFILLDPILLFFMFASVLLVVKLSLLQNWSNTGKAIDKSFTPKWWFYLLSCGILLGFSVSVKLVGLFMVAYIGVWTINDLWKMMEFLPQLGSLYLAKHLLYRIIGLIMVPGLVYVGIFALHFYLLTKDGPGAPFYSSLFQTTLKENPLYNRSLTNIEAGSAVVLRNNNDERVYLHSHPHFYPAQMKIDILTQQVTGYSSRDSNNLWKLNIHNEGIIKYDDDTPKILRYGDTLTMQHLLSSKVLSLVKIKQRWAAAPLTKWHLLVAGENHDSIHVNGSNYWRVEAAGSQDISSDIFALISLIRLFNIQGNCYLCSSNKALPDWGKKQHEIVCSYSLRNIKNCVWYIESSLATQHNAQVKTWILPTVSFFMKFIETHKIMLHQNSKLVKRNGDRVSKPWHWPFNFKPKLFSKAEDHIYLKGTPALWLINLVSIISFIVVFFITSVLDARTLYIKSYLQFAEHKTHETYCTEIKPCCCFFVGWFIHYVPFFFLNRVLFFHHYFSAHIFACMLSGTLLDLFICKIANFSSCFWPSWPAEVIRLFLASVFIAVVASSFYETFSL